jgi:hypothetical protein
VRLGGHRLAALDSGNHRVQLWPAALLRGRP